MLEFLESAIFDIQAVTDKSTEMLRKGGILRVSPAPDKRNYGASGAFTATLLAMEALSNSAI